MNQMIAVVGMAGSGKSIVTEYLEKHGFTKIYFGGIIYQKMKEEGIEITPTSQREYCKKIRKELGMGAVATLLLPQIVEAFSKGNVVLDGLYSWDEYLILKEVFGNQLTLLAVILSKKLRYKRIGLRKDRPFTLEQIEARDVSEIEHLAKGGPIAFADEFILNNGSQKESFDQLNQILKKLQKEGNDQYEKNDKS